jgi:hypothetical protein
LKLDENEQINDDLLSAWKLIKEINAGFSGHHKKAVTVKVRKKMAPLQKQKNKMPKSYSITFMES